MRLNIDNKFILKREENLERLNYFEIPLNDIDYLVYKSFHNDLITCLKNHATGKLIDIGCGNKPYFKIINNLVDEYIGCDIVQSSDNKVDVICDAAQIPFPDSLFDTAIMTQVIEHIADHQLVINESFRVLKNGGHLIISGPMYWPLHEEPYDFFRFTKYGFRYILNKAGFKIIEEYANGGKWALCGQAFLHALHPGIESRKSFYLKIVRKIFHLFGGNSFINKIFVKMDDLYPDPNNTMNYVIVAKKTE